MKNKLILTLLGLFTMALSAQNYSYFENDIRFIDSDNSLSVSHFGEFPVTENFGITDYFQIETGYAGEYGQGLVGVYYKFLKHFSVALFAGIETTSKDARYAILGYYVNGDKYYVSAFYQRSRNPFDEKTRFTEWFDYQFRYGIITNDKNSLYVGARYMKYYGLGVPIGIRQSTTKNMNLYLFYTTYYDIDNNFNNDWVPTISFNIEFL